MSTMVAERKTAEKKPGGIAKSNGTFSSKWTHLPIGMPYWNEGWAGGQPQLFKPKSPFFRVGEPPPVAAKEAKKYDPSSNRVMF